MKASALIALICECEWPMMTLDGSLTVFCQNPDCQQYGKKFKRPTIELEEI